MLSLPLVVDGQPRTPMRAGDFEVFSHAAGACRELRDAGFLLVVVTNQPDVARGLLPAGELAVMQAALRAQVPLDDVRVCPHDDDDGCTCRKPQPGMLLGAAAELGIDVAASYMVGDRWKDIEAGRRAGCRTVLVDLGWRERTPEAADGVVADLADAAAWILGDAAARSVRRARRAQPGQKGAA